MGKENGARKPVPGKALLPTRDDVHHCESMLLLTISAGRSP